MTVRLLSLSLLTLFLAAGCGGNKYERDGYAFGCPTGMEKKIKSKEALVKAKLEESGDIPYIEVTDLRCSERSQLMRVEVDLMNDGEDPHSVAYRFRWLDREGMRAWDEESWKPVMIYGKTRHTISTSSPTQDAADFRVELRSLEK
jgi:uncharacterized protein YcfL